MSAGVPGAVPVPDKVRELAAGDHLEAVWRNELGGLTFRARSMQDAGSDNAASGTAGPQPTRYIKWQSVAGLGTAQRAGVDLESEASKLRWAARYVSVPQVIEFGRQADETWLVTQGILGAPAIDSQWRQQPEVAVRAIARGLRQFHDALPVAACPYQGTWPQLEGLAVSVPDPERLVVCHGDPCVPNTLLSADGSFLAHVDLARLGVADCWADLAIATYSISWNVNFGQNYDALFFDAYGITPDPERIQFYRNLWDGV